MARSKKKKSQVAVDLSTSQQQLQLTQSNCYEGERLIALIKSVQGEIELAKLSKGAFPEKIWIKQQFSIGVNDVTRVLEWMTPSSLTEIVAQDPTMESRGCKDSLVQLQAVLLASDCNPRWLIKHIPVLASSRRVPVILVKDKKGGSLRLGEIVKLKTAIAIGVKAKGSGINKLVAEILEGIDNVGGNAVTGV